jgi:hypothetical protein
MADMGAIANIGDLAKPATALIEKVSGAIGTVYEPHHIRRIARANADAAIIEAQSTIEVNAIHRRALSRFVTEEGKKQENIETITAKAVPYLDDDAEPQGVEDDWVTNFFEKGRLVSDDQMQELWARVLAGEANVPGTFSRRTVATLESFDKADALGFQRLCRSTWNIQGVTATVYDFNAAVYKKMGIDFGLITHLASIGLVRFEPLSGFNLTGLEGRRLVHYHGRPIILQFPKEKDNTLSLGKVLLTQAGEQLALVCHSESSDELFAHTLDVWREKKIRISSPWPLEKWRRAK